MTQRGTPKSEQYLVRVTEEQADVLAALQFLFLGSSPADVLRVLLERERARRQDDELFASLLTARADARAAARRSGLSAVKGVKSS